MVKRTTLPYTARKRNARTGRMEWWFRRGRQWKKLPGDPGQDTEASALYWRLRAGTFEPPKARTMTALIASYRQSPAYAALRPVTRRDYDRVLAYIEEAAGRVSVASMKRPHIIAARNRNADRPSHANRVLKLLSILFEHALDAGWVTVNPAKGVEHLPGGEGHKPWPSWAIANFRAHATGAGRTAFELCLGTGQRIGDVLRMRWDDIEDGGIWVRQSKTGAELWIPFTPDLEAYLATLPRGARTTIITNRQGGPISYRYVLRQFHKFRDLAGFPEGTPHGLRYNAASELFEAGCSDAEVMAITGHRTASMAHKYGRGARQKTLAKQARERGR